MKITFQLFQHKVNVQEKTKIVYHFFFSCTRVEHTIVSVETVFTHRRQTSMRRKKVMPQLSPAVIAKLLQWHAGGS